MKKIWYLKDVKGQTVKAVKVFLYEKNGNIAGKMDLSAFYEEGSKSDKDIALMFKNENNDEIENISLPVGTIIRDAYLNGKGQLRKETVDKIETVKGEIRLSVTIGEKRYLSEGWKEVQKKDLDVQIYDGKEATPGSIETNHIEKTERGKESRKEVRTEKGPELEAEELLPEDRKGKRIVQLSTLEDELTFRTYIHNSFLLHGYYNYGHVVVDETEDEPRLGVPGNYYERELMVASMFGFPDFEPMREEEKVQNGTFGYYYTSKAK